MDSSISAKETAVNSVSARKETAALRGFSFAAYATHAAVVSFLPLYFLDKGFTPSQIGIIASTGPFISIFANLLLGWASDRFQTIKKLLTLLLFGQLASLALLFPAEQFAVICAVMTAFYFFQTPINPLSDSLFLLSSQYTGTPYALIRIFGSLGFAASAFAFGLLLKVVGTGWTLPIALGTITLSLLFSFIIKDYRGSAGKIDFSGFFVLMRKPQIVIFFFIILLISISHRMYEGFLGLTLREMGASDSLVGSAWLLSAMSEIPILFLLGKYGHKFKEIPLLVIACLLYALRLGLLSEISDPRLVLATQLMHSVTFGIYFSTALRYISRLIPDEFRSSGQAVHAIVWTGIAGVLSGTFGGYVFEFFGRDTFFHIGSALALVAAGGFIALHLYNRNRV
ncbi:MFS transporter [Paenibacillus sp. NPDC058071]|uniref:MFS transporter n=1 Tax=Paenibacillus sp. NPDC058071 TaxID=3346326 RepID=UPI0036D797B8